MASSLATKAARASSTVAPVRIVYDAPVESGCPDGAEFRDGIAARLGYDPFSTTARRLLLARIDNHADGKGSAWRGTVELVADDGSALGKKTLTSGRCADLVPTMTLAASLAIDPL